MKTLTIDIGTTTIKCAVFEDGVIKSYYGKEYDLNTYGNSVTQKSDDWVNLISEGINSFEDVSDISGISISSQGITILPVDKDGKPMTDAISWLDASAEKELEEFKNKFDSEYIFSLTGKKILPYYSLSKIKKLVADGINAYKYLMPSDYIYFLLTGKYYTDYTMASGTMLFDINKRKYDEELLGFCGISEEQLAKPLEMGEKIGTVTDKGAEIFGIPKGVAVFLGAQDQKISAYALRLDKGKATVSIGTSTAVSVLEGGNNDMSVFAYNKNDLIYESALNTTGAAIKWLKNLAFESYEEMDKCALEAGNSNGCLFDSDFTDGAVIKNIDLSVNKGSLVIALYEDIARRINNIIPDNVSGLILFGGGAKSRLLCDTISRITDCKIEVPDSVEVALAGADLLIRNNFNREEFRC